MRKTLKDKISDKLVKLKVNHKLIKFVIDWQLNHLKPRISTEIHLSFVAALTFVQHYQIFFVT